MSFTGQLKAYMGWEWVEGATDSSNLSYNANFAEGVDPDQAEAVFHVEDQSLLWGNSVTYDLTALVRDVIGDPTHTTTFITIKGIVIVNSGDGGELVVGNAASNEWSECFGADGDTLIVPADSVAVLSSRKCGWEVDDTNKSLKIAAQFGDTTYSLAIMGTLNSATGECSSSA